MRTGLCAIALVAYANSFVLGLALDGRRMVKDDTRIRAATAENIGRIVTKDYWWPLAADRLYRPVTTASYLFNYAVLGNADHPAGYHWVNFLLHVANVWLVFEIAMLLFQRAGPAFFAAAIWAVHPAGTEAVANVAGRADLLGALAVLGGLLLYMRTTAWTWRPLLALFAISMSGLLSKENAAVLIGLMLLGDIAFGKPDWVAALRTRWPAYGVVAASLAIVFRDPPADLRRQPAGHPACAGQPAAIGRFLERPVHRHQNCRDEPENTRLARQPLLRPFV